MLRRRVFLRLSGCSYERPARGAYSTHLTIKRARLSGCDTGGEKQGEQEGKGPASRMITPRTRYRGQRPVNGPEWARVFRLSKARMRNARPPSPFGKKRTVATSARRAIKAPGYKEPPVPLFPPSLLPISLTLMESL